MQKLRLILAACTLLLFLPAVSAQTSTQIRDFEATYLAKVISLGNIEKQEVPNTNTEATYQDVTVIFLDGEKKGVQTTISDTTFPLEVGDRVYVRYLLTSDGTEYYSIQEPYRLVGLLILFAIFVAAVVIFGGKHGFLSLVALFISFGGIFKFLFPEILNGGNVVLIATGGALLSLFVVMYLTHGMTRLTTSAFLGCSLSVLITLLLAKYAVALTSLTGFSEEESVYLNVATGGNLDFVALLIGGIIIGVIGVIDDVSITQASVVSALLGANKTLSKLELYSKALKVGKDHMGAVINTLILAYAGASLPLILLLYTTQTSTLQLINSEVIATEIVRSIVGSMGLLLAVPLTTLIAVFLIKGDEKGHTHHRHH